MIEKATSFKVRDRFFETIEKAQAFEINLILCEILDGNPNAGKLAEDISETLISYRDRIIDILTTTESSKPKARKINGGSKKRKPVVAQAKPEATEEKPPF